MKNFILLTAVIELLAGAALFLMPTIIPSLDSPSINELVFMRMYGAAALTVGFIALMIWKQFELEALQTIFVKAFTLFHAGVAVANFKGYLEGSEQCLPIVALHGVLAIITCYFWMKKR